MRFYDLDDEFHEEDDGSEFQCRACEDQGWMLFEDGSVAMVIPCTECSFEPTMEDLIDGEAA